MEDGSYIDKAQQSLNSILKQGVSGVPSPKESQVTVAEARQMPVLAPDTGRTKTRVLFVTTDTSILTQTTKSLDGFTAIADMFYEVHIMVLRTGIKAQYPVLRVDAKTWLYTVTAKRPSELPFMAWRMMHDELIFADGFRPDILIAREVGMSAFTVYGAGKYYERPTQLHIPHQYRPPEKWLDRMFHRWLIRAFPSVRVTTTEAAKRFLGMAPDVAVLPRFRNYVSLFSGQQGDYLKRKYPQFSFIMLYAGELTHTSTAFTAIDAVRHILRNPRVGFLMVGNGTGVMECERRAELLGIKDQVIIERRADAMEDYMQSADVLIITDTDETADELALYGASAGIPMIMTETNLRRDLFTDGVTAFILEDARSARFSDLLVRLLNDNSLRYSLRSRVRQMATERLHVNEDEYRESYRQSIEMAVLALDDGEA